MAFKSRGISSLFHRITAIALFCALTPLAALASEKIEGKVKMLILKRSYTAYLPDDLTSRDDWPVLMVLHPGLADGEYMERMTKLHQLPDAQDFIVVYPDGFRRTWNAGECCGQAMKKHVDDIGFLLKLVDELNEQTGGRVRDKFFITGFSNGAIMAYHMACEVPERLIAIAPFGSAYRWEDCDNGLVPVMHIHGDSDISAPHEGGSSGIKSFDQRIQMAASDTVSRVATRSNCSPVPHREEDHALLDTRCQVTDCGGVELKLCVIEGLGHTWPGAAAEDNFLGRKFGPGRTDIFGSQAILDFFEEYL